MKSEIYGSDLYLQLGEAVCPTDVLACLFVFQNRDSR